MSDISDEPLSPAKPKCGSTFYAWMIGFLIGGLLVLSIFTYYTFAKGFSAFKPCPTCPEVKSGQGQATNINCQWFNFPQTWINGLKLQEKNDTTGRTLTDVQNWVLTTLGTSSTNCKDVVILWSDTQGNFSYGQLTPTQGIVNQDWTAYVLSANKPNIIMSTS